MTDLLVALGLLFAIEGLVLAGWPQLARRIAEEIIQTPPERLRFAGVISAIVGVAIIWLCRG